MSVQLRRTMELPCELPSVTSARHFVRDSLMEWGLPQLADDAQLGVSELVANAVRHARTPVELTLELNGGLRIAVHDQQPELLRPNPGPQVDVYAENGRGLQLVAAIAQDWGISTRDDGKVIWFALNARDETVADDFELDGYATRATRLVLRGVSPCPTTTLGPRRTSPDAQSSLRTGSPWSLRFETYIAVSARASNVSAPTAGSSDQATPMLARSGTLSPPTRT